MQAAHPLPGQRAQPPGAVVAAVALPGLRIAVWVQQQPSVLGHEQEQQPVDQPQQLPIIVLLVEAAGVERLAQGDVAAMGQEAAAQTADRQLHAELQAVPQPHALALPLLGPALQPALSRSLCLDAGLVAEQPEQHEVGVQLAVHHRLQVELHVGLPGQGGVVAQQSQHPAIGDDPPEVVVGAIEQLLHQAVRAGTGGTLDAGAAAVQRDVAADQMDRRVVPAVGDGIRLAVDTDAAPQRQQPPVAQLVEQRQQPALAGDRGARVGTGQYGLGAAEGGPGGAAGVPGTIRRLGDPLARQQMVALRLQTLYILAAAGADQAFEQIGRQQRALGAHAEEAVALACSHGLTVPFAIVTATLHQLR